MKISNSRFILGDLDHHEDTGHGTSCETRFWRFALALVCVDAVIFVILY